MKRFCSEMMVWIMMVVGMLMDGDGVRDDKQKSKAQKRDSGVDQKEKEENGFFFYGTHKSNKIGGSHESNKSSGVGGGMVFSDVASEAD